jgi:uncharacterized protein YprB with RNaseH-like and TPR domain
MANFGKALRGLAGKSGKWSSTPPAKRDPAMSPESRLVSAVRPHFPDFPSTPPLFSLAEQLRFLRSRPATVPTVLPPGEVHFNGLGSHYCIHEVYPQDYFHGKVRLSRLSCPDLECLMKLMREKGSVPDRDRIVFLDTETTGIQGGAGIYPFLVGIGYFVDDDFHMVQYFIRDFDEEPSMLLNLAAQLEQFELAVTYNGAAFDIPLLETRFTLARLENPFLSMSHFDLLFTARKLWRNGHGSCRLVALEDEIISFLRGPDIPGALIPRAYFDYLECRPAPALGSVFRHNVYDVISLAALTIQACDRVAVEPAALDEPLDLYSLGRVFESSPEWRRSIRLYEMALAGGLPEPVRIKALENLAIAYRRAGEHDRSREVCTELMRYSSFSVIGYEGAAIYYERVVHDFERALRVLEEGLARAESKRWRMQLQSRWDRLQQKTLFGHKKAQEASGGV